MFKHKKSFAKLWTEEQEEIKFITKINGILILII